MINWCGESWCSVAGLYICPEKFRTTSRRAEMGQNFSGERYDRCEGAVLLVRCRWPALEQDKKVIANAHGFDFIASNPCPFAMTET